MRESDGIIRTVVDVGASGVRVCIGAVEKGALRVYGFAENKDAPLIDGAVADMAKLSAAVSQALIKAEQSLKRGLEVEGVVVAVSSPKITSQRANAELKLSTGRITQQDIHAVIQLATRQVKQEGERILHVLIEHFGVDEHHNIDDPLGMMADKLSVSVLVISMETKALDNILSCVKSAAVMVNKVVFSALSLSELVLDEAERERGVCLIDIGSETTKLMFWRDYRPLFSTVLPEGGVKLSKELARRFITMRPLAEQLKVQHATLDSTRLDGETLSLAREGRRPDSVVDKQAFVEVVRRFYCALLVRVAEVLYQAGIEEIPYLVFTGGGARVAGLVELAESMMANTKARVVALEQIEGMPNLANELGATVALSVLASESQPIEDFVGLVNTKDGIIKRLKALMQF